MDASDVQIVLDQRSNTRDGWMVGVDLIHARIGEEAHAKKICLESHTNFKRVRLSVNYILNLGINQKISLE